MTQGLTWYFKMNAFCIVLNHRSGFFLSPVCHPLVQFIVPSISLSLFRSIAHSFIHLIIQEVHRGFPDAKFAPTHVVVATWENVAAYEEQTGAAGRSNKVRWMESVCALMNE